MRSRTGCLTCRQRKLKCDEQKPVCSQCRKASRECRPSDGIVFRHQQNASMNADTDPASPTDSNLKGFYSYKNTFDDDSVWLEIPKRVTFVDNSDPFAEDLENSLATSDQLAPNQHDGGWNMDTGFQSSDIATSAHGLEALSAAATRDQYPFLPPPTPSENNVGRSSMTYGNANMGSTSLSPTQPRTSMPPPTSPSVSISSNNNINFLLNPSSISPPIDPNLQSPLGNRETSITTPSSRSIPSEFRIDTKTETEHEVAFLLRHFSEAPGQWMDLFDLGTYFASYVPVKALTNPLLKNAACAYAAKQLGRAKGVKAVSGGVSSAQASMELWPDSENVDWFYYGAKYYDRAIQLLMEALQNDGREPNLNNPEAFGQWRAEELCEDGQPGQKRRRRSSVGRLSNVDSDEVLTATAILSVYEFLDASGPAWSRHLSGAKSLLDIAEVGMMPVEQDPSPTGIFSSPQRLRPSKARKATFWNFARQDYLAAFINESQTRLNPEDLVLWKDAGLLLDNHGFVRPSNTTHSGYPEGDDMMKEDMISNALIWLLSKIVNFIAAGDGLLLPDTPLETPSAIGISQQTLLELWGQLQHELEIWFEGLPDTFRPCARIEPPRLASQTSEDDGYPFPEIWYSIPMCASTMQHYHMARILLLINKPHESTARRSTVTNRLRSYRSIESEIRFHSHEICGISMSRPEASVRIHSLQPLFVSGQCLTEPRERRMILNLLRGIEGDIGWATEYRAKQLLKEWEWDEGRDAMSVSG